MFSKFFIERPHVAIVLCIVLALAGAISIFSLPVQQYPDVSPPQVCVTASYRGADAETIANTLAAPLEQQINGVKGMIYMTSTSNSSGAYELYVSFDTGTNPDMALVRVQNRVFQIQSQLPMEVVNEGITIESSSSNSLGFISLRSPNGTYGEAELMDYVYSNIRGVLQRIPGMGGVTVYGSKYSIRVWLDPARITSLGLSIADVTAAIQSQNQQASIGAVGAAPGGGMDTPLTYPLQTKGRLSTVRDFENIVVTAAEGGIVHLRDVARVELGSESYNFKSEINNAPAAMIDISQTSGSNALEIMAGVRVAVKRLSQFLPEDMTLTIEHDSTDYVRATIREILITLALTLSLVVAVCYLFLQEWRTTLVPVAAIPVSLLATFAALLGVGYSINMLSLFGLVLVVGTVVDDAIVVVERVQFIMERDGCDAKTATVQAMKDVTGPLMATTFVFLAIFTPVAFLTGITGQIYKQFAVTIGFAVCFSLVVALTLSPAMCARLLTKAHPARSGPLKRFNDMLAYGTRGYVAGAGWFAQRRRTAAVLLFIVIVFDLAVFTLLSSTFIPDEDQGVVFAAIQLPEGATMPRTEQVVRALTNDANTIAGVKNVMSIYGYNVLGGNGENVASLIIPLNSWNKRKTPELQLGTVVDKLREAASKHPQAEISVFTPPAIDVGTASGIDMRLQSTLENDPGRLMEIMETMLRELSGKPEIAYAYSPYTATTPHLYLDINRKKAEMMKVPVSAIFLTLQTYFGSYLVNNVNIGTQTNSVMLQSEWKYRDRAERIGGMYVRSADGEQVPMQSLMTVQKITAPRAIDRYNLYPTAPITITMKPGFSTGQGIARVDEAAEKILPAGYTYEWSGMTYQEKRAQRGMTMVLIIALVFAFLFLVAQYGSWSAPAPVVLSIPIAIFGALVGFRIMNIPISVYGQLGILLLVGLASKNAILIVEFAKEQRELRGLSLLHAATVAAGERFRAVLMTAFTCVLGTVPMLFASGAGAASRKAVGSTLFFGMMAATIFGIFLIPALFVIFQGARENVKARFQNKEDEGNRRPGMMK